MYHHTFSIGHEIAVAATRGVVYDLLHHLFRGMGTGEIALIGSLVLALVWALFRRRRF